MPLSMLPPPPRDGHGKTRGQDGSLFLSCRALSSPATCRFIPALSPALPSADFQVCSQTGSHYGVCIQDQSVAGGIAQNYVSQGPLARLATRGGGHFNVLGGRCSWLEFCNAPVPGVAGWAEEAQLEVVDAGEIVGCREFHR